MSSPMLGRIVTYRTDGRNGLEYDLPAIITCTKDSHPGDYPDGHSNPLPVPSSDTHVHLTVFTPGGFGTTVDTDGVPGVPATPHAFKGAGNMTPGSGTYVEWDVPYSLIPDPRSWH